MNLDFPQSTTTVAHASTVETHWDLGRASFLKLKEYCSQKFYPLEVLSEQRHPEAELRPVWQDLQARIEKSEVTLLILPTLFHIAGSNLAKLSGFLKILETRGVKLIVLKGEIDSDKLSRSQMLLLFVTTQLNFYLNQKAANDEQLKSNFSLYQNYR